MAYSFRAIATDYDGTLTAGGPPSERVRRALRRARAEGRKLVLVTGRILAELWAEFPEAEACFDAVVAENGAVLRVQGVTRRLAPPVPPALAQALIRRGVPARSGEVLLATLAIHASTVLEEAGRLGLECELIRNRGELMVLPTGVSKGTGLFEALGELGVSAHSTLGVGDGENDHSLLEACEVGVAVANAVEALKARADVVLSQPAGEGVAALLEGPLVRGEVRAQPARRRVTLGEAEGGRPIELPCSGINVLVAGGSGCGKSYLAGLLAERLIRAGYACVLLDPEGDHAALGRLRGALLVGGEHPLPEPERLPELVRHRFGSVVADLSRLPEADKPGYARAALAALQRQREQSGLPHWIFVDEAHAPLGLAGLADFAPEQKGFCLVTYHPEELLPAAVAGTDFFLLPLGPGLTPARLGELLRVAGVERAEPGWLGSGRGRALRVAGRGRAPELFRVGARASAHVRHWHKYLLAHLPPRLCFLFRDARGPTGRAAANVAEFHHEALQAPDAVIAHHAACGDFSRWARLSLQDPALAEALAAAEARLGAEGPGPTRAALLAAVEARYQDQALQPPAA